MNRDVKERWVKALRSGKYKQAKRRLVQVKRTPVLNREKRSYCCLGVLCEIAVQDNIIGPATPYAIHGGDYAYSNHETFPPPQVKEWSGFDVNSLRFEIDNESYSIVGLNDDLEWSFDQIADLIEAQVPVDEEQL